MSTKTSSPKHKKLRYTLGAVFAFIIVCGVYAYHISSNQKPSPTLNQYTKGQAGRQSPVGSSSQSPASTNNSKTVGAYTLLVAPSGNFVSNHHPNLSGSPAPNAMASVCNTTPGASCQIIFVKAGVQKSLPSQITDSGGSTYWNWTLGDTGLTTGVWEVKAISGLDGKTKTSDDAMSLVVSS